MSSLMMFYLSRIIGNRVYSSTQKSIGKLVDLVADVSFVRPKIIAAKVKMNGSVRILDYAHFCISKAKGQYIITCSTIQDTDFSQENAMYLVKNILDRQIVDMDGRKLVRVNDVRLAVLANGAYTVAVDIGIEGLLRRLGVAKPVKKIIKPFGLSIPAQLILWDDVETIDFSYTGIKLTRAYSKLSSLHASELADIIEELDVKSQVAVFNSLDEETAADVLEELESEAQVNVLESLSVEKAADVLEKMPADEVADILEELEEDKAEELLSNMETEAREEVRELMEYTEDEVGSIMTTDYIAFNENMSVQDVLSELRQQKPEPDAIYYLYIVDNAERLIATVSLRDIVVHEPETELNQIMNRKVVLVHDNDDIDSLAEIISKYNLLAVPVVDDEKKILGTVLIDDIVYNLLRARRRRT